MIPKKQVYVTGQHEGWIPPEGVEFNFLDVLEFKSIPVPEEKWKLVTEKPFDWIVFTSPRAVRFWTEGLLSQGLDFPIETRVACIGEKTAEAAQMDGYSPDFYPSEPGSETFVLEFKALLKASEKTRVLIPGSSIARPLLKEELKQSGCEVESIAVYETVAKEDLKTNLDVTKLENAHLFLFTSPSSVEAVCTAVTLPLSTKVGAIGSFTKESLLKRGFENVQVFKEGLC